MTLRFLFLEEWDNRPGGTVVKRFKDDGIKYVEVKFDKSPDKTYLFLDEDS